MLLKAVIVDDEPVARKVIKEYLEDIEFLELAGMAENPLKADALLGGGQVDLLFLDINMPKLSGIEFLRASERRPRQPLVIITTAYAEYALDGFELDVVDYLVKPFSFERFLRACNKARSKYAERFPATRPVDERPDHFFVKCDGSLVKVLYEELEYVEALTNYIVLHTASRQLIVYLTMKGVLAQLPADRFVKVHKSFIVNKDRVRSIRGNVLQLGAAEIPVSQHYYEAAMQEILRDRVLKRE
jgi:DNA-binding LytR/AlgR family response regulator